MDFLAIVGAIEQLATNLHGSVDKIRKDEEGCFAMAELLGQIASCIDRVVIADDDNRLWSPCRELEIYLTDLRDIAFHQYRDLVPSLIETAISAPYFLGKNLRTGLIVCGDAPSTRPITEKRTIALKQLATASGQFRAISNILRAAA